MTSGPDSESFPVPPPEEFASVLRHDLVNPINLIVGYCELLLAEAADQPWEATLLALQSIRRAGFLLLQVIDGALLDGPGAASDDVIRDLGEAMLGPSLVLVHESEAVIESARRAGLADDLTADLDKIRSAAAHLVVLAGSLESGSIADHDASTAASRFRD